MMRVALYALTASSIRDAASRFLRRPTIGQFGTHHRDAVVATILGLLQLVAVSAVAPIHKIERKITFGDLPEFLGRVRTPPFHEVVPEFEGFDLPVSKYPGDRGSQLFVPLPANLKEVVRVADDIRASFEPFFEQTSATPSDPNLLYTLQKTLEDAGVLVAAAAAVDRFKDLDDDAQVEFRDALKSYVRAYAFLAQVMPWTERALEELYLYGRALATLPRDR